MIRQTLESSLLLESFKGFRTRRRARNGCSWHHIWRSTYELLGHPSPDGVLFFKKYDHHPRLRWPSDSQKRPYFHNVRVIRANRLKPAIRNFRAAPEARFAKKGVQFWETDFYTPPVLGGAALLPFSAPAVYKNQGP